MTGVTTAPVVSVLLATHNRASILEGALAALSAQKTPPGLAWEAILVDNNSTDATRKVIETAAAGAPVPFRYVFEGRQGKSFAVNTGLEHARGAVIALTDDDVQPAPDWIACAAGVLDRWNADAAGGCILPFWEIPPPAWLLENKAALWGNLALLDQPEAGPVTLPLTREKVKVWGANMVVRRALLDELGGLDTRYGPVGERRFNGEDTDLIRRTLTAGHRVVYDPALTVFHRIGRERLRRRYFYRWEFDGAEGAASRELWTLGPHLWGAPRPLYGDALIALFHWLSRGIRRQPDRLQAGKDFWRIAGRIRGLQKRPAIGSAPATPWRPSGGTHSRDSHVPASASAYARTNVQLYNQLAREGYAEADVALAAAAYRLAVPLFAAALRPAGQPFLGHLVATASILASLRAPIEVVAAGLLHSTYTHGEFGNGWLKMTADRRALVRAHVGDTVETLVARYTTLPWITQTTPTELVQRFDELDQLDRIVLLMRLVNELDEHLDLNAVHCADAERRQHEAGSTLLPCVTLAERLGEPELAAELAQAFKETVAAPLRDHLSEPATRSFLAPPLSHAPRLKVRLGHLRARLRG